MSNLYDASRLSSFRKFLADDLTFVEYTCDPGGPVLDMWSHHGYFTYVLRGAMYFQSIEKTYVIEKNKAYFVQRGAYHIPPTAEEFCDLVIFIPDHFICQTMEKHQISPRSHAADEALPMVMNLQLDEHLRNYYQSLFGYFMGGKSPSASLLKVKLEEFVVNILENPDNHQIRRYCKNLMENSRVDLRAIMENNFNSQLTIREFAKLSARSLATFRRDFRQIYHTPPGQWLRDKRLNYSRFLLLDTDKSIEEVMFSSGFSNRSHFSRLFKKTFGMSPLEFKKSAAGGR